MPRSESCNRNRKGKHRKVLTGNWELGTDNYSAYFFTVCNRTGFAEAAKQLSDYCVTSTEEIPEFIPIVNPERKTPYRGNTDWAKAANTLWEQLRTEGTIA